MGTKSLKSGVEVWLISVAVDKSGVVVGLSFVEFLGEHAESKPSATRVVVITNLKLEYFLSIYAKKVIYGI